MESSSIFDQFPVTQGDDTDQTAAVDWQEEHCLWEGRQQQRDVEMRLNLQSRKKMEEITRQQQKWLNSSPNRKL